MNFRIDAQVAWRLCSPFVLLLDYGSDAQWTFMTSPGNALTEEERKLLQAAVTHANLNPADCHLKIERIQYGFRTNLSEYAEVIIEQTDRGKWETSLKCLISHNLLRHVSAGNQTWTYAVTDQGFAAVG